MVWEHLDCVEHFVNLLQVTFVVNMNCIVPVEDARMGSSASVAIPTPREEVA